MSLSAYFPLEETLTSSPSNSTIAGKGSMVINWIQRAEIKLCELRNHYACMQQCTHWSYRKAAAIFIFFLKKNHFLQTAMEYKIYS